MGDLLKLTSTLEFSSMKYLLSPESNTCMLTMFFPLFLSFSVDEYAASSLAIQNYLAVLSEF